MVIKQVSIKNFRNIEKCSISLDKKLNVIIGDNAQGKTNFLESIYFSNFYKSFRTKNNKNLIHSSSDGFTINLEVYSNYVSNNIQINYDRHDLKKIKLNNKSSNGKSIYSLLNVVFYYPAEINYLTLYPAHRRNLIDRSVFFVDTSYIELIKKYNKLLKQRNLFLKNGNFSYDPWVDQLIDLSAVIIKKRIEYSESINAIFIKIAEKEQAQETYSIKYKNKIIQDVKSFLAQRHRDVCEKEKVMGYTLFGPHIDDFSFCVNGKNIKEFSSEGQKKYFLLTYKYAQLIDYYQRFHDYPILLFDDYMSELDENRRKQYFEKILEQSGQIFLTATELSGHIPMDAGVYRICDGALIDL